MHYYFYVHGEDYAALEFEQLNLNKAEIVKSINRGSLDSDFKQLNEFELNIRLLNSVAGPDEIFRFTNLVQDYDGSKHHNIFYAGSHLEIFGVEYVK